MNFLPAEDLRDEDIVLRLDRTCDAVPEKNLVPACYFSICLRDGTKIGSCDLRIGHSGRLYYGGNIGYGIDAKYRGHHYAAKACRLLFGLAARYGMEYLYITCDPSNAASSGTCLLAGGQLVETAVIPKWHNMYAEGKREVLVYRFDLASPKTQRAGIRRKHTDRREWFTDGERQFASRRLEDDAFCGGVGRIVFTDVRRPMCVSTPEGPLCIADRGIEWLELAPEGGHFVVTAMFRGDELFQQYIDITLHNTVASDGSAVFEDLFLDVVILGDGTPKIVDREELDAALQRGWITGAEADLALRTADEVVRMYREHAGEIAERLRDCRAMFGRVQEDWAWGF